MRPNQARTRSRTCGIAIERPRSAGRVALALTFYARKSPLM